MLNKEEWRDIPGYEGYYQASTRGRLKSLTRIICLKANGRQKAHKKEIRARLLKFNLDNTYLLVSLNKNGKSKIFTVHELTALTFIGPRPNGKKGENIRHIDNNPHNNHYRNLAYSSSKRNHVDKNKSDTRNYGERNNTTKLSFQDVGKARKLKATIALSNKCISEMFNISPPAMFDILKGKNWNPDKFRLNIKALEKEGKIKEAKRIKRELKIITPIEWVEYIQNTNF